MPRYRWTNDWPGIIAGATTPEGNGVAVEPGKEFETVEPIDVPFAEPVESAKKTTKKAEGDPEPVKET